MAKHYFNTVRDILQHADPALRQVSHQLTDLEPFLHIWRETVPYPACRHIQPVSYRNNNLTVWVKSPVWANWVRHRHNFLISSFSERGLPLVQQLFVRVSSPAAFSSGGNTARDRPQPDSKVARFMQQTANETLDPDLRASLQRLSRTLGGDR